MKTLTSAAIRVCSLPFLACLISLILVACSGSGIGKNERHLAPLSGAELASASWPVEGFNGGRNRVIDDEIAPPLVAVAEFATGEEVQFVSPVAIANGRLFADGEHILRAFTLADRSEIWHINLPGSFLSPAVVGEQVFIRAEAGEDGYLVALSTDIGAKLWEYKFPTVGSAYDNVGGHVTSPVVVNGTIFVGAAQLLFAIDAATGEEQWRFRAKRPIASSAAVVDGVVYFTDFTRLYALDQRNGAELWQLEYDAVTLSFAPIVAGDRVFITSYDTTYALDKKSGDVLWSRGFNETQVIPAAATDDNVYVKSANQLFVLDASNGEPSWSYSATNFVSLPVVTSSYAYVVTRADGGSQLRALRRTDGMEVWRTVGDFGLTNTAPIAAGGQVYARTVDGRIVAFQPTD